MKNRKYLLIFLLLLIIYIPKRVDAIGICGAEELSTYKSQALKISFNYKLVKTDNDEYFFKVTALNVNENFVIEYDGRTYQMSSDSNSFTFDGLFAPKGEYIFKIYTSDSLDECPMAYVGTRKLKTPKYNPYSEADDCIEYEEFPLCDKYYEGDIESFDDFKKQLHEYLETYSIHVEDYKDERTIWDKFIELYKDNIEISVTITALIILIIIAIIIKKVYRWATRTKIKFNVDENK